MSVSVVGHRRTRLASLTGVRFFAAAGVVLFHIDYYFGLRHGATVGERLADGRRTLAGLIDHSAAAGALGVNLFFVLSGFILTYNYLAQDDERTGMTTTRRAFYLSRFARIYPVYLFAVLFALSYRLAFGMPCLTADCSASDRPAEFISSLLLVQSWTPSGIGAPYNGAAWTLSVEAFFYACFPLAVAGLSRLRSRRGLIVVLVTALAGTQVGTIGNGIIDLVSNPPATVEMIAQFTPIVRLPEFIVGAAAWCWISRYGMPAWLTRKWADVVLVSAAPVVAVSAYAFGRLWGDPLPVNLGLFDAWFLLTILALAGGAGRANRILRTRPAKLLGEASFALYILHWPAWFWYSHFVGPTQSTTALGLVGYGVFVVGFSVLIFLFVERPTRRLILRIRHSSPPASVDPIAEGQRQPHEVPALVRSNQGVAGT